MDKREWEKVERIVDEALERPAESRIGYIKNQCGNDAELFERATQLLDAIDESRGFLEQSNDHKELLIEDLLNETEDTDSSLIGQSLGSYEIVKLLGHGGMSSVYLAERDDGKFNQKAALKLLRSGMDTPKNLSRFRLEQNILADLKHPNIAQLYDGGVTSEGLPYLVMEYVDGTPVTTYCDENKLSVDERLELFKDICRAVQHAHSNLVIHRDLKPDNILVTSEGVVKILDFGISKLIQQDANTPTTQTQKAQQMLTPAYASPEQFSYDSITTAIDNYALGGLLHKLLTGFPLFDLAEKSRTEISQLISRTMPQAPSKKLASLNEDELNKLAQKRSTSADALLKTLRGDLDAIVLKAVRKEPDERYESPSQIIEELERYQQGHPLTARSDDISYRLSKFIKRHQIELIAAVATVLCIIGFASYHTYQITQERNKAQLEAQKAEEVTTFLTDLIEANAPSNAQGDTVTVREFLNSGFQQVQQLDKTPTVQAEVLRTMGHTYRSLGDLQKASVLINNALQIQDSINIANKQAAETYNIYGIIQRDLGNLDSAHTALHRSISMYRSTGQTNNNQYAKALRDLAYVERVQANYDDAYSFVKEALRINQRLNKGANVRTAETLYVLASVLRYQNKLDRAIETQKKSLQMIREVTDGPHPGVSFNLNNLANLYDMKGDLTKAKKYREKSLAMDIQLFGKTNRNVANTHSSLSGIYLTKGKIDSAEYHTKKSISIQSKINADAPQMGGFYDNYAKVYAAKNQFSKADSMLDLRKRIVQSNFEPGHPKFIDIKISRGRIAAERGNFDYSIQLFKEAFNKRKQSYAMSDQPVQEVLLFLVDVLEKANRETVADSLSEYIKN